ncbi:hypothetical protein SLS62_007301 [Diatrype stigma]|uniref:DUF7907 domain-containing protein n=1 Tax=Diatrype stigma TaxID=117547 RepID=A0AAN9UM05_9PEZI
MAAALTRNRHATTALAAPCQKQSDGFNLRVQLSDPARDLTPSVDGLYLSGLRVSQGSYIGVASDQPSTYYLNDTTEGGRGATVVHDIVGVYPFGLSVQGPTEFDSRYPTEHDVGLVVAGSGSGVTRGLEVSPSLTGPGSGGTYLVCRRTFVFPSGPAEIVTPRFLYEGESIPDEGCVPIAFVPECAALEPLPDGASWNHDSVITVSCVR